MKFSPFLILAFASTGLLLNSSELRAQLVWPETTLEFKPGPTETKLHGSYAFENKGGYPVTIVNVKPSCGCTTAQLDKKTYAPGEKGKIDITFDGSNRSGFQEKEIAVQTDDSAHALVSLKLKAWLPEIAKTSVRQVVWFLGDKPAPKTIRIEIPAGTPTHLLSVSSTNYQLMPVLKTIEMNKLYEIEITPADTKIPARATLIIRTNYPSEAPKSLYASAEVRGPMLDPKDAKKPAQDTAAVVPAEHNEASKK